VTYCNKFILITLQDPSNDFQQKKKSIHKKDMRIITVSVCEPCMFISWTKLKFDFVIIYVIT